MRKCYKVGLRCNDYSDCSDCNCSKETMIYNRTRPIEEWEEIECCAVVDIILDDSDPYLSWYQVLNEYHQVTETMDEFKAKFNKKSMIIERKLIKDKNYFNTNDK